MERYVGIDLGLKTKHKVTVYDGLKQVGKPFAVETSQDGFEYLLKRVTAGTEGPVNFVFEPTSNAWLPVSAYVSAAGHRCYLVKTQKASDLRKFYSKHAKSDSID
jgi:transposase